MKRIVSPSLLLLSLAVPAVLCGQQPSIIDRALFFGEVQIAGAQISPDGQYLSFLKPYKGTRNIWVKKASEPFSAARPISDETKRPIRQYFWTRDSKYVLYARTPAVTRTSTSMPSTPRSPPIQPRACSYACSHRSEGRSERSLPPPGQSRTSSTSA